MCINSRRYVCCSECNVVSNKCEEPSLCPVRPIGTHGSQVMYFFLTIIVQDLHKLSHDLHPYNLSKKENDQWFGGILIQYNCLSNFYKIKLIHDDTEFDTIKAAY